jgi:hypothetical protein
VKYLVLAGLAILFQMLGGCATSKAMKIGSRVERVAGYQAVYASGDTLVVRYRANLWTENSPELLPGSPDRWGVASFGSLRWVPLASLNQDWIGAPAGELRTGCPASRTASAPLPPQIPLRQYQLLSNGRSGERPITAYAEGGRPLILLRRNPARPAEAEVTSLETSPLFCRFDEPWAPYARAALVPFAAVFDAATSIVQGLFMWALVSGKH